MQYSWATKWTCVGSKTGFILTTRPHACRYYSYMSYKHKIHLWQFHLTKIPTSCCTHFGYFFCLCYRKGAYCKYGRKEEKFGKCLLYCIYCLSKLLMVLSHSWLHEFLSRREISKVWESETSLKWNCCGASLLGFYLQHL